MYTKQYIEILQRRSPHPALHVYEYNYWWEVPRAKYSFGEHGTYSEEHAIYLAEKRVAKLKKTDDDILKSFAPGTAAEHLARHMCDYKINKVTETVVTEELEIFETRQEIDHE